jgi:hypothetical protein
MPLKPTRSVPSPAKQSQFVSFLLSYVSSSSSSSSSSCAFFAQSSEEVHVIDRLRLSIHPNISLRDF